jgi:hypothetical protein
MVVEGLLMTIIVMIVIEREGRLEMIEDVGGDEEEEIAVVSQT